MQIEKIKPMLAQLGTKEDLNKVDTIFEPLLEGTRVIFYKDEKSIRFLNRKGKFIEYKYPELYNVWSTIRANFCILDCEIIVFDSKGKPSPSLLKERETQEVTLKIEEHSRKIPATLIVFDILNLDGEDLKGKPLWERKQILERTVFDSQRIKKIIWTEKGLGLWQSIKSMNIDGVMAKDKYSPYSIGKRSNEWLNIKESKNLDVVVCGYTKNSLVCGVYFKGKLTYIGNVELEKQMKEILKSLKELKTKKKPLDLKERINWVKPQLVIEVKLKGLENMKIKSPSFSSIRKDKPAEECVLEEKDIVKLS